MPAAAQADSIVTTPGSGLVFNNTWGSGATLAYENCVVAAEKQLEGIFTNKDHTQYDFQSGGDRRRSRTESVGANFTCSYATLKAAILKLAPNDVLPSTDPSDGKGFAIPESYARMLGLTSSAPANDATITLDGALNWDFGQDAVNAITHAITESAMGRDSGLGDFNGGIWTATDLFRYTAPTSSSARASMTPPTAATARRPFFPPTAASKRRPARDCQFTNLFDGTTPALRPQ